VDRRFRVLMVFRKLGNAADPDFAGQAREQVWDYEIPEELLLGLQTDRPRSWRLKSGRPDVPEAAALALQASSGARSSCSSSSSSVRPMPADDAAVISALAREHGYAAIDVLVEALDSPNPGERVAAAIALLNAGYGAPVQPIALDSTHGVTLEVHTVEAPGHRSANGEDAEDGAAWRAWLRQREG
jgi:hypothetical protein